MALCTVLKTAWTGTCKPGGGFVKLGANQRMGAVKSLAGLPPYCFGSAQVLHQWTLLIFGPTKR